MNSVEPSQPEQKAPQKWQRFQEAAQISSQVEDEVRSLINELANLGEPAETFGQAVTALKSLELITQRLEDVSENLKPKPTLKEVSENLSMLFKPRAKQNQETDVPE